MKVELSDIITIVIAFQLFIFSIFLFVKKAGYLANYLLGIQLFSQAAGVVSFFTLNHRDFFLQLNPNLIFIGYPFVFLWGPTFYLYVKSAAYTDFKLKLTHIIHIIPFIAAYIYFSITFYPLNPEEKKLVIETFSYPLFRYIHILDTFIRLQVLLYIILSVITLIYTKKLLKERYSTVSLTNLPWLRFLVIGFIIAYVLTIPVIIRTVFQNIYSESIAVWIILPYFIYFNIIFFKGWYQPSLFEGVEESVKYKSSKLKKDEADIIIKKIKTFMSDNKPFLNPDLSLSQLAANLNISQRILSQVINEYFNQNFYDYVNSLRVEESKKMLIRSGEKTVLEILYETGFNSKSTFNYIFKKMTGQTPTEFRRRNLEEAVG